MPAIETAQWLALKSRVNTLVTNPVMTVYEPDAIISPGSDANGPLPHIGLSDPRNDNERIGINTDVGHIRSGTLMLAGYWPIARAVTHTQLLEIGGQIAAHFTANTCMTYGLARLRVARDADVMAPYVEGAWRIVRVNVPWVNT